MSKFEIRTATANDYRAIYGHGPEVSMRAWSVFLDGKLAGIAGVTFGSHLLIAFSRRADGITASKRLVIKIAREIMQKFREIDANEVVAIAEPLMPCSGKFLELLGFRHVDSCPQGEVYKCKLRP